MRRFSQRNSLVTLSDINITPLLDLAFVLLIIFIITTPLLEQGLDLKLPTGTGRADQRPDKGNIRTVEISPQGRYMLGRILMSPDQIELALKQAFQANPQLLVYIRADENCLHKQVAEILKRLERVGISQVSIRTEYTRAP
jgi:biopolymer transport protein ExbD